MEGKMLFFNAEKDYGFIRTAEDERIAVNRAGFAPGQAPEGRCAGLAVKLTPVETPDGRIATDVTVIVEKNVGRARRRSSR